MLSHLHISDFTIVQSLNLELGDGFVVLTGETGAGKSVVIDALSLVLGARAEAGVIRQGSDRAEISASFSLKPGSDAAIWLQENELFEDGECTVRRIIYPDKPTKGFINGRPVPMQMLRELGDRLVDIHGQHEHQSLLKREAQREILDSFSGLDNEAKQIETLYREIQSLKQRLDSLQSQSADRSARIELLQYQVQELEALALEENEIPKLEEEHTRLANGATLLEGVQSVAHTLYDNEEGAASQLVSHSVQKLESLSDHDPKLGEIAGILNEAAIQIDEAASQLHHYLDRLELDPARLQWLDQRIAAIHDLSRKHHVDPEDLPGILLRLKTELEDIEDFDVNLSKLEDEKNEKLAQYHELAERISEGRSSGGDRLAQAVTEHMQELGMPGGQFAIRLEPLPEHELGAFGKERVEYLVSANPGQAPKPLTKVASGGELSRISLALQVVAAEIGKVPTLIFDEVDVGIGGRVAEIVGLQLNQLGKNRQVLCITHLAQVAAQGDSHLQVQKTTDGSSTTTTLRHLAAAERVSEIARMIGGVEISEQTLAHAEDMLSRAAS
ncbi:MAG: DNA repair protein RecN [Acidiferrobacterales bacterium]